MRRGLGLRALAAALLVGALLPAPAFAHGLVVREDLPIPEVLFQIGAAVVLIVSFVGLALLWPTPRLQGEGWRPLPGRLGRALASPLVRRPLEIVAGLVGTLLLAVVVWSGLAGVQASSANFAPTFVYVVFWLGLLPLSVLFGDVFRAFNPWRAIGRGFAWVAERLARGGLPAPLPYPERLGRWPAAAGIFLFAWLELVADGGEEPRTVATAALVYSAATFLGMALYGVDPWIKRAEAFSVYFNLFSRLSIFERRDGEVGVRRPLSGLTSLEPLPGTVALLMVMIGSVTFDGLAGAQIWQGLVPTLQEAVGGLGLGPATTLELTFGLGLVASIAIVAGFYGLGTLGASGVGGGFSAGRLSREFAHSLAPIALVYAAAHYVSLLVIQGQAIGFLASDPLGRGWNVFGTATATIDYGVLSQSAYWYMQVAFVVVGHVAALTLAHDRALALYERARLAVRSQYWMLAVMVGFTLLALFLLAEANKG